MDQDDDDDDEGGEQEEEGEVEHEEEDDDDGSDGDSINTLEMDDLCQIIQGLPADDSATGDHNPCQYLFLCVNGAGQSSGWQDGV